MARVASLVVKLGALLFIFFVPTAFIINLQLLGGIIIIQTLPVRVPGAVHEVVPQVGAGGGMGGGHRQRHLDVRRGAQQLHLHVRDRRVTASGSTLPCPRSSSTWW